MINHSILKFLSVSTNYTYYHLSLVSIRKLSLRILVDFILSSNFLRIIKRLDLLNLSSKGFIVTRLAVVDLRSSFLSKTKL